MACPVPAYHRRGMTRRPERKRCILPHTWNFCTSRTRRSEYSFSELTEADRPVLMGYLVVAARMYRVELAFAFVMANHIHLICRAAVPEAISLFHAHFKAQFARYINRKHKRSGSVWGGRFHNVNLLDDEAQRAALVYGIDHGMKESLVIRSDEWHLPHTLVEMCGDGWLRGKAWRRAHGRTPGAWRRAKLRLTPLDRWSDDPAGFRQYVRTLLEARVQLYTEQRAALRAAQPAASDDGRRGGAGRLLRVVRQHDYVPGRSKRSRSKPFRALGPNGDRRTAEAEQAHVQACEVYEVRLRRLVRGAVLNVPTPPTGYQWPTAVAAALGLGVVGRTWRAVFDETSPMGRPETWSASSESG